MGQALLVQITLITTTGFYFHFYHHKTQYENCIWQAKIFTTKIKNPAVLAFTSTLLRFEKLSQEYFHELKFILHKVVSFRITQVIQETDSQKSKKRDIMFYFRKNFSVTMKIQLLSEITRCMWSSQKYWIHTVPSHYLYTEHHQSWALETRIINFILSPYSQILLSGNILWVIEKKHKEKFSVPGSQLPVCIVKEQEVTIHLTTLLTSCTGELL